MDPIILNRDEILPQGRAALISRSILTTTRPRALHSHQFYELLWVQNGRIRHHTAEGPQELAEGSLLFVQPRHAHALQAKGADAMVVSLSLGSDLVAPLAESHPRLRGRLFWSDGPLPDLYRRNIRQMAELNAAAMRLEQSDGSALAALAFLLPLLAGLTEDVVPLPDSAPAWLAAACAEARDPRLFRDGAAGLVRASGRAHSHVSRTVRQFLGQSPSEFINGQRMRYAAMRLTGTSDSLGEIAADCGIPNLSHFHKLFLQHHGTTPAHYRRMHQRNAVQPDLA